jgi:transposase
VIEPPDLKSLDSAGKDALILALIERINSLIAENAELKERVARLEAKFGRPPKTPDNSSLPPSQGQKASGEAASRPKGKPHRGSHRELHPDPTRTLDVRAEHCPHCAADVSTVIQTASERYDRIELPEIKPDVTRVVLHGGSCPCCARRFKAAPPAGLEPGSPFGPNLRAFAIYLRFSHAVSFERLSRLMSDLLGVEISEGALVNILDASRSAFARQASLIRARLLASSILESDETSVRVGKRTWWTWVFHHADDCCFVIRPSRGKDVVTEFLGEVRPDFWVSDRLAAQMGWASKDNQVCLAHLIREAQYAIDAGDTAFAPGLRKLLKRACSIGGRRATLADATLRAYAYQLDARLDALLRISSTHAAAEKLLKVIKGCRRHLFVFLANRAIPPTNNGSEQALRPCVIFRKVTNCFRSEWGAQLYADIRSIIETARRRAIGPLDAIISTLKGLPLAQSPAPQAAVPRPSG